MTTKAKRVQVLGGATAALSSFTGRPREIIVDTTESTLTVHNGTTPGGRRLLPVDGDASNVTVKPAGASVGLPLATLIGYSDIPTLRGADRTGALDSTAAIQASLDSGKPVYLPPGTYRVSQPLVIKTSGQHVYGLAGSVRILTTSATDDIFQIGDGVSWVTNVKVEGIAVWTTVAKTAGAAVHIRKAARINLYGLRLGSFEDFQANGRRLYDGIVARSFGNVVVDGCYIIGGCSKAVTISDPTNNGSEFVLTGGTTIREWAYGIHQGGGTGGLKLTVGDISNVGTGVLVDDALVPGVANREIIVGGEFSIDNCDSHGFHFASNSVFYALFDGGWSCGHGGKAVYVAPGQPAGARWKYDGFIAIGCGGTGIDQQGGILLLSGSLIHWCGRISGGDGVALGAAIDGATISGSVISSCGVGLSGQAIGGYSVSVHASANNFAISNNDLRNSATGGLNNAAGISASKIVTGNLGAYSGQTMLGNLSGASTTSAYTWGANPDATISGGGYVQIYGSAHPVNPNTVILGAANAPKLTVTDTIAGFAVPLVGTTSISVASNALTTSGIQLAGNLYGTASSTAMTLGANPAASVTQGGWVAVFGSTHAQGAKVSIGTSGSTRVTVTDAAIASGVPIGLPAYTVATLPSASTAGRMVTVSDRSARPAWSNGSAWIWADGTTVS